LSIVLQCLYEAGKFDKLRLLDIFCEILDPEARYLKYFSPSEIVNCQSHNSGRNNVIRRVLRKLRWVVLQARNVKFPPHTIAQDGLKFMDRT